MIQFRSAAIAVIAFAASAGLAVAQPKDDTAHHAAQADVSATQPASPGGMPTQNQDEDQDQSDDRMGSGMMGRGMMGGGMMGPGMMGGRGMMGMACDRMAPMMHMMQGMTEMMQGMTQMMQGTMQRPAFAGMMSGGMVEGRIASLKAQLGITDAQQSQWNAFVDALRARAKAMQGMRAQIMPQGTTVGWPDRLAQHERRLSAHLDAMKAMEGPVKGLWDVLSDEQRRNADDLLGGPMGVR